MLSIVIPTFNGLHLLRETLPSVLEAAQCFSDQARQPHQIIVVDDGSKDGTPQALRQEFPALEVVERPNNGGFARACNTGFQACRYPVVALLNNDVRVTKEYFVHLVPHFESPDVFAVTARVFEWGEAVFATGGKIGRFRRGFWSAYFNYDATPEAARWIEEGRLLSFYAVGGFAAYQRRKLLELEGFNELLSPFHWEDIDLSYRGLKRGWTIRYEPRSNAFHRTSATIDAHYRRPAVVEAATRNRLLFHWINIHRPSWLISHFVVLAVMLLTRIWAGDLAFYRAFLGAFKQIGTVRRLRRQEALASRRDDRQVARLLLDFYRRAPIQVYYDRDQVIRSHPGMKTVGSSQLAVGSTDAEGNG
ncbi:MAG: glycosyltransferase family 2 protein [Acidobacteriota bacterium]